MKKILKHLKKNWYRYSLETLVVIMGVLIAFSLNNWNTNIKNQQKELVYISSIIEDIEDDITRSKNVIDQLNNTIKGIDSLLLELSSEEVYTNSNKAYSLWMNNIGFDDFISNDRTIQLLKHSSGFEFITRTEASNSILEYDQNIENYNFQSELLSDFLSNLSNPQTFQKVFDVITLEQTINDGSPIALMVKDKSLLNQLYGNRNIWKVGLTGLVNRLEDVNESGKRTNSTLREIYNLNHE